MGFVYSKFCEKKSTLEVLEQLDLQITSISNFKACTEVWQKKVVGYLVTYSIVIYLVLVMVVYFKLFPAAVTRQEQLMLLLPFLVFPGLIWGIKKFLTWWYHRKVKRDDMKLEKLKEKKTKILEEVMEKETYKVAKQILDKFGQTQPAVSPATSLRGADRRAGIGGGDHSDAAHLRRRGATQPADLNTSLQGITSYTARPDKLNTTLATIRSPAGKAGNKHAGPQCQTSVVGGGGAGAAEAAPLLQPARPLGLGGRSAPGPPLPRPVLPRERGYLDKFVEFLVGDGPSNRFALICRQCQSHNGMALKEEFEYVAYRCCYCYYWNPARKQRPVAPRLPVQPSLTTVADFSATSARQSMRGSLVMDAENEVNGKVVNDPAVNEADIELNKVDVFGGEQEEISQVLEE